MTTLEKSRTLSATFGNLGSLEYLDKLIAEKKVSDRELKYVSKILSKSTEMFSNLKTINNRHFRMFVSGKIKEHFLSLIEEFSFENPIVKSLLQNYIKTKYKMKPSNLL